MKASTTLMPLAAAGLCIGLAMPAAAAPINLATYDFATGAGSGDTTSPPASSDPLVEAGDFASGSGVRLLVGQAGFNLGDDRGFDTYSNFILDDSLSAAVTGNEYWTVTIGPTVDATLTLDKLTFNAGRRGGNIKLSVMSSVDGFSSTTPVSLADIVVSNNLSSIGPDNSFEVDLSDPKFANLTSDVEFRFYIYDAPEQDNSDSLAIDNVTFTGTVVPEPGAIGLLGLGAVLMLTRHRAR